MQRRCDSCGEPYEAKRKTSRFCSSRCRMRAQRAPVKVVNSDIAKPITGLAEVTQRELEAAGRLDTVIGQQAMRLAERMGSPAETGSSVAALSRELRAVMDLALASAVATNPLDELRQRRELKRAG